MKGHLSVHRALIPILSLWVVVATAATAPDPDIVFVTTGGYWEHGGRGGHFRVVVRRLGYEHIGSQVVAEWVAEPASSEDSYRVVLTKQLQGAFLGSLGAPELTPGKNEVRVKISGGLSHFPNQSVTCEYLLKADGAVRVVRECS